MSLSKLYKEFIRDYSKMLEKYEDSFWCRLYGVEEEVAKRIRTKIRSEIKRYEKEVIKERRKDFEK